MKRRILNLILPISLAVVFASIGVVVRPPVVSATTQHQKFVVSAYYDLLQRAPSAGELALYEAYLDGGGSRQNVASSIVSGDEFRTLWFYYIRQLYLDGFEFDDPSNGPLLGSLLSSGDFVAVETATLSSASYFLQSGGTNVGYVTALYRDVLDSTPTALAYWETALNNGTYTRSQLANFFVRSAQSSAIRVSGTPGAVNCAAFNFGDDDARWAGSYCLILDRMADSGGASYWTAQLGASGQLPAMWASIMGSNEYFTLSQM